MQFFFFSKGEKKEIAKKGTVLQNERERRK